MSQITTFVLGGGGGSSVLTLTGNSGGAVSPTLGNINILGSGATTVVGNPGTSTLTISVTGGGIPWTVIIGAAQVMAANNGYIANNAGTINFSLPAAAAVGSILRITGINNATGWQITQAAGQQIFFGLASTTLGAVGTLTSSATRDSIELVCVVANTTYNVLSSIGNITVV